MAEGNAEIRSLQVPNLCIGPPCNILKYGEWHFRAIDVLSQEYTFNSFSQNM